MLVLIDGATAGELNIAIMYSGTPHCIRRTLSNLNMVAGAIVIIGSGNGSATPRNFVNQC